MHNITITNSDRFEMYDQLSQKITELNKDFCIVNVTSFYDSLNEKHTAIIHYKI